MRIALALAIAVLFIGGMYWLKKKNAANEDGSKVLINEPTGGEKTDEVWRDINFKVASTTRVGNDNRLLLEQTVEGKPLKLFVDIPADLMPGLDSKMNVIDGAFREKAIRFHPDGDAMSFVAFMQSHYELNDPLEPMPNDVIWDGIALQGDPRQLQTQLVKIKMFATAAQGDEEDPEAQLFLNIDLPNRSAVLSEKDMEYRRNVFMVFTGR